jgi:sugar/nucleoside kinase (ribokinase family)
MLDVIVEMEDDLRPDDDSAATITLSAGGQAANVATWVAELGGRARVYGPRADTGPGRLVEDSLRRHHVEVWGSPARRSGAVVSLVRGGTRTLVSDPGDLAWLDDVRPGAWLDGADWLFLSGYALVRAPDPRRVVETAGVARAHGTRIAVDLASASMVARYGADRFSALCRSLRPSVIFANDAEWEATSAGFGAGGSTVLVLKHGEAGASFIVDGVPDDRSIDPGPLVDVTGAGDAMAAGFLVGGIDLAMTTAARCIAQRGAQPSAPTS